MIHLKLPATWSRRADASRSCTVYRTERGRERLISLATTALVLLAGAGSFGMSSLLAS